MALDDDAARVLELVRLSGRPPFEAVSPIEARALFLGGREVFSPEPQPVAETRDLTITGPHGQSLALRLYRATGSTPGMELPGLVFFHGGGWVVGDLESHDTMCRHIANRAGCAVIAVDYRLAPEHKFPAAVEDCLTATEWLAENGNQLGIDRKRLAVGGDSAGGNLAAVVSLIARDRAYAKAVRPAVILPGARFRDETGFIPALCRRASLDRSYDALVRGGLSAQSRGCWRLACFTSARPRSFGSAAGLCIDGWL